MGDGKSLEDPDLFVYSGGICFPWPRDVVYVWTDAGGRGRGHSVSLKSDDRDGNRILLSVSRMLGPEACVSVQSPPAG